MNSPSKAAARRPIQPPARVSSARAPPGAASVPGASARVSGPPSPNLSKRAPASTPGSPPRASGSVGSLRDRADVERVESQGAGHFGTGSSPISRASSAGDCRREASSSPSPVGKDSLRSKTEESVSLFHTIQQLAAAENALWNILDGLKSNTTHASFFCREYWGCSCSQAQLSLEKLNCQERLKRQVQQASVLESLSLGVASHLCSGVMQNVSVTIRSRLRNLLYYIHENCLVLLDMVCQRWLLENQNHWQESSKTGHCPENLNLDILVRVKRYRRLRRGEHVMALRQHNEMIANVARQLCRGAATKRPPLSSRGGSSGSVSPGPGSRGLAASARDSGSGASQQLTVMNVVNDILTARMPLDRLKPSVIRSKMLQSMTFRPLLNVDGSDPDCPWPVQDPYIRYGADAFAQDGPVIWFEPLPPMLPNLEQNPKLPPAPPDTYTLVLDLDETLIHYHEHDGMGNYDIRPGMHEFIERMSQLGYELVIFTAATQDYADWVIDQIDPNRLIHHRIYRQHALPWGPIFVKDLSRLGRELDRTLIIDNVQENFMLQPHNGIFIFTWYDDPNDTALYALMPLLDELIATRVRVPEILDKYRDQIPTWAGFDQYSQLPGEYESDLDLRHEDASPEAQLGYSSPERLITPLHTQTHQASQAPEYKVDRISSGQCHLSQQQQQQQQVQQKQHPHASAENSAGKAMTPPVSNPTYVGLYQPPQQLQQQHPQAAQQQAHQQQLPQTSQFQSRPSAGGYLAATPQRPSRGSYPSSAAQQRLEAPAARTTVATPQQQTPQQTPFPTQQQPYTQHPMPPRFAAGLSGPCQAPPPQPHGAAQQRGTPVPFVSRPGAGPYQAPRR